MHFFKYMPQNGLNFGDELGPYIINCLLKHFQLKISEKEMHKRLFSVGSVIHFTGPNDIVWGSGINGKVPLPVHTISKKYYAVRGPQTQKILSQFDIECPAIYGDPAILLPSLYSPKKNIHSDGKILIIPNYNDYALISKDILKYEKVPYVTLLHPYMPPLLMIDLISSAKAVITSSLHAKIIADSYKIPNAVLGGSDYAEHPFKYIDYVQGVGFEKLLFANDIASGLTNIDNPLPIKEEIITDLQGSFPTDLFDAD